MTRDQYAQRNAQMCEMYIKGYTLQEIAHVFGVKRQRVYQIVKRVRLLKEPAPPRDEMLSVCLDEETKERIRKEAERRGMSMSSLSKEMIKQILGEAHAERTG